MKTILIPTDERKDATLLLEGAIKLICQSQDCRIVLINAYLVPAASPDKVIAVNDEMKKNSKELLEKRLDFLKKEFASPRVKIETESHMGTLGNVLSRLLQREKFDLLVTGPETISDSIKNILRESKCSHLTINP